MVGLQQRAWLGGSRPQDSVQCARTQEGPSFPALQGCEYFRRETEERAAAIRLREEKAEKQAAADLKKQAAADKKKQGTVAAA